MRGNWSVKCLEGQGKKLVARAETIDSLTIGREFTEWVELVLGTSEVCDRQVVVCPTLIVGVTGRVQTFERT